MILYASQTFAWQVFSTVLTVDVPISGTNVPLSFLTLLSSQPQWYLEEKSFIVNCANVKLGMCVRACARTHTYSLSPLPGYQPLEH